MATISNEISEIATNIKKIRKKNGISQDKLHRLTEIAYDAIVKIEWGAIQSLTIESVQKTTKALDVSLTEH